MLISSRLSRPNGKRIFSGNRTRGIPEEEAVAVVECQWVVAMHATFLAEEVSTA